MEKNSLDADYFIKVYEADNDPWNFEKSAYEASKYQATIRALPKKSYKSAFEIGCSIAVLTNILAKKCEKLLATDVSEKALSQAKERCKNNPRVTFKKMSFPQEFPPGLFDLIMISEVAYYLSAEDWKAAIDKIYAPLLPQGHIALVHWLPKVHDYPQTGDEVHNLFKTCVKDKMKNIFSDRQENYRIDIWEKGN